MNLLIHQPRKWQVRDEFLVDRVGVEMDGTSAEPGPGTRHYGGAVDIESGKLVVSAGGSFFFSGVGFTGMTSLYQLKLDDVVENLDIGLFRTLFLFGSNVLSAFEEFVTPGPVLANVSEDVEYMLANVYGSVGGYYFWREGNDWKLLIRHGVSVATGWNLDVGSWNLATGLAEFVQVSRRRWLPTPLIYDTFTRANGALGNSETGGPDGQTTPQKGWSSLVGTVEVTSNAAKATALSGGVAIAGMDLGKANIYISAIPVGTPADGSLTGVAFRYVDSNNYMYAYLRRSGASYFAGLKKVVGGVTTPLFEAGVTFASGGILRASADGNNFRVYYHNSLVNATTDSDLQSGTKTGLYFTTTTVSLDNFMVFDRVQNGLNGFLH